MEILGKVAQLFLSAVMEDKLLLKQKYARAFSGVLWLRSAWGLSSYQALSQNTFVTSAGQLQRAGNERGKTGKGGNSGLFTTDLHTASSAAANCDSTEEIPLFPWDPPMAVQVPQGQAEFCKQALKSSCCPMHAITAFVICSFLL